ncbi:metal-dependent hydrolase [Enterovibrio sp. 27052020O]|uniref:oxidoreductase n=1 Tax=Enterovibrio sp. 27052020O TaxID=3241166 RepID=UPI00388D9423
MTELLERPLVLPCGLTLKNRLIKTATAEGLSDRFGRPTLRLLRLYKQWAASGASAIITGNIHVDSNHREQWRSLVIDTHGSPARFKILTQRVRREHCALIAQLNHGGPQTPNDIHHHPFSPSDSKPPWYFLDYNPARAMSHDEIESVIEQFSSAARFCHNAGFSGVQIHAAHGYLLSAFLSPAWNHRTDKWGSNATDRARIVIRIIEGIKNQTNHQFAVGIKLNCRDFIKGGTTEEDCAETVRLLCDAGADFIEISGGSYLTMAMSGQKAVKSSAYFADYLPKIRQQCSVPLLLTGGIRDKETIDRLLGDHTADLIGMARPFCLVDRPIALLRAGKTLPGKAPCSSASKAWRGSLRRLLPSLATLDHYREQAWFADTLHCKSRHHPTLSALSPKSALNAFYQREEQHRRDAPQYTLNAWWGGRITESIANTALVIPVSCFEQFFCDVLKQCQLNLGKENQHEDFKRALNSLIEEESAHSAKHKAMNKALSEMGYPVEQLELQIEKHLNALRRKPLDYQAAYVAAAEAQIAEVSKRILAKHKLYQDMHPPWRHFLVEHASDEIQHQWVSEALVEHMDVPRWTRFKATVDFNLYSLLKLRYGVWMLCRSRQFSRVKSTQILLSTEWILWSGHKPLGMAWLKGAADALKLIPKIKSQP